MGPNFRIGSRPQSRFFIRILGGVAGHVIADVRQIMHSKTGSDFLYRILRYSIDQVA